HFLFTHPPPTDIYTLSLHDALPIYRVLVEQLRKVAEARVASGRGSTQDALQAEVELGHLEHDRVMLETEKTTIAARINGLLHREDRKSTRLNSSHVSISYAVFCLKK